MTVDRDAEVLGRPLQRAAIEVSQSSLFVDREGWEAALAAPEVRPAAERDDCALLDRLMRLP